VKLNSLTGKFRFLATPYFLVVIVLATLTFWVYFETLFFSPPKAQDFYTAPRKKPILVNQKKETDKQNQLSSLINFELSKLEGHYAIIIKDLSRPLEYKKNENDIFTSASIYKLAVMYKIFDMLEKKQLQETDEIQPSLTVANALSLSITVSDNNSALALAQTAGWEKIDSLIKSEQISGFSLNQETPTITAKAVSTLLEKIYNNKAVSPDASIKMKQLLLAQKVNDRIPKYLPSETKVAHKTGELDFIRHDAGIVYGKKSDYIFIFLSETPAPSDATENIANLSKKIFDALESPSP